jgi:hypothetical protein
VIRCVIRNVKERDLASSMRRNITYYKKSDFDRVAILWCGTSREHQFNLLQ